MKLPGLFQFRVLKEVAPMCEQAIGTDISDTMLLYAYDYVKPGTNIFLAPMHSETDLRIIEKTIDKLYSFLVLQHIEKPKMIALLKEFHRVLKNDGNILLSIFEKKVAGTRQDSIIREEFIDICCNLGLSIEAEEHVTEDGIDYYQTFFKIVKK